MRANQHKFMEIADRLAEKIALMQPGDRLPTADEIKKDHRITIATASRVIKELRQRGLIHSKPGAGSYVARVNKHEFIICVPPSIDMPYSEHWYLFHSSLCNTCNSVYDQYTILTTPGDQLEEQLESLKNRSLSVAGVIFFRDPELHRRFLPLLNQRRIKSVFFGSSIYEEEIDGPGCYYDEDNVINLIFEHLRRNGHSRIGCIYDSQSRLDVMRHMRYRKLLSKSGEVSDEWTLDTGGLNAKWFDDVLTLPAKKQFFRHFLAGLSALIILHDNQAAIIMQIISHLGVTIPEDISVVSIDNLNLCELMRPRLDSVDLQIFQNAPGALDIINGKTTASIHGAMKLQIRDSVSFINSTIHQQKRL